MDFDSDVVCTRVVPAACTWGKTGVTGLGRECEGLIWWVIVIKASILLWWERIGCVEDSLLMLGRRRGERSRGHILGVAC